MEIQITLTKARGMPIKVMTIRWISIAENEFGIAGSLEAFGEKNIGIMTTKDNK
jgi:hypothetical protein